MTAKRRITMALVLCSLGFSAASASAAIVPPSATAQPSAPTAAARVFANCTAMNKVYPHGVGRKGAKDRVSGSTKPVTTFAVNTAVYNANKKSDRDKDGVACEKR
jgi:Excalibur calcium-binding domain